MLARTALLFIGALVLALPVACGGDGGSPTAQPTAAATLFEEGTEIAPQGQVPELTPDEQARAREIILNDPRVAEVRGGSSMDVDDAAIWHLGPVKLGAGAHIHFDPPVTWEGPWQFVDFPSEDVTPSPDPASNYRLGTFRMRVEEMTEARVLVDLTNGTVLTVVPVARASFVALDTPDPRWTREPQL